VKREEYRERSFTNPEHRNHSSKISCLCVSSLRQKPLDDMPCITLHINIAVNIDVTLCGETELRLGPNAV